MVAALFVLGVVAGVSVGNGLNQYMDWVRSRFPAAQARGWRLVFTLVTLVVLVLAIDVLQGGPDQTAFTSGAIAGYFGAALWHLVRWMRQRRR